MTTTPMPIPGSLESRPMSPATYSPFQLFYWSVLRELWEYRSIYIAPLAAAAVGLFGFLISIPGVPRNLRALLALHTSQQRDALAQPFDFAAVLIMGAAFIVTIFYSIDALYGERRDRSILFWKSLPVSDLTAVLAKASIPLVVLPLASFGITVVTGSIMFFLSSLVALASGLSVAGLWNQLELPRAAVGLLYHLVTIHMLWYAPFYAWLLMISAWARRAPILWALIPPFALGILEKIAFNSSHFAGFLLDRFTGGKEAVDNMPAADVFNTGMHLTPGAFLLAPGLWIGLAFAAVFLGAAARLRRYRGPS